MIIDWILELYGLIERTISLSLSYFVNTEKRIHILYLATSIILAYYVYKNTKIKTSFLKYLFPKKVWTSKSAFIDYSLFCFNSLIKIVFIGPYIIIGFYIAFYTNEFLLEIFGFASNSLAVTQTIILYTITITIVADFFSYITHYLMHRIPLLWEFHKVHHSATTLNPLTQYRIHPVELIINNIRSILIFGLITGIFDYLSDHQVDKVMFLGANIFTFFFFFLGANLRHSHVKLKYPSVLEYIFISPFQHQIHHSLNPEHFNKNMGSKFAIWDYLFGTLVLSLSVSRVTFGIPKEELNYNSFLGNLINPFLKIIHIVSEFFRSFKNNK
jgi:sterol desaturase/sphingolipid hydroxylase (fatty acid hydroxylase superfamily)